MEKEKSIQFYNILKSLDFKWINNYSPKNFEYLFGINETKEFFDWFLENVNGDCTLSASELNEFEIKHSKSQIIYNIDKLKNLYNYTLNVKTTSSSSNNNVVSNSVDALKKRIDQKEAELNQLNKKIEFRKQQKHYLINELNDLKSKKQSDKQQYELNLKQIYYKNQFKQLNMQFKGLIKNLVNDIHGNNSTSNNRLLDISLNDLQRLSDNEEKYLDLIENLLKTRSLFNNFDVTCDSYPDDQSQNGFTKPISDIKNKILLIEHFYPKIALKWFTHKCENKIYECQLYELNKFYKLFSAYLGHSSDTSDFFNENLNNLGEKIKYMKLNLSIILNNCSQIGTKISVLIKELLNYKLINLINYDLDLKQFNYEYTIYKQECIINNLIIQNSRLMLLMNVQKLKLNDLDLIRQIFELIKYKLATTPSIAGGCMLPVVSPATTINCSSSFLFPSTSTVELPTQLSLKLNLNSSLASKSLKQPQQPNSSNSNEKFIRILNQLLIIYLTRLNLTQNSINSNQKISIKLNENLNTVINLYKMSSIECKKAKSLVKQNLFQIFQAVIKSIAYLYKTNDLNLSKINMDLILDTRESDNNIAFKSDSIKLLDEYISEIENLFYSKIFQVYNAKMLVLRNNPIEQIKRTFFVEFYKNPKSIPTIIQNIDNI